MVSLFDCPQSIQFPTEVTVPSILPPHFSRQILTRSFESDGMVGQMFGLVDKQVQTFATLYQRVNVGHHDVLDPFNLVPNSLNFVNIFWHRFSNSIDIFGLETTSVSTRWCWRYFVGNDLDFLIKIEQQHLLLHGSFCWFMFRVALYFSRLKLDILGTQSPKCLRLKGITNWSLFVYMSS